PRDRFYLQHWWSLIARTEIHLYRGDAESAWNVVNNSWPALRSSLLLGVQYIRVESVYHRACAALALGRGRALRQASTAAARLAREQAPWADGLAASVEAGLFAVQGDEQRAAACLARAESAFAEADMALFAAAARWSRGRIVADALLMKTAEEDMQRQGV